MFNSAKEEIRLTLLTLAHFSSAFVAFAYGMAVLVGLAYGADDADPLRSFLICLFLGAAFLPFASASAFSSSGPAASFLTASTLPQSGRSRVSPPPSVSTRSWSIPATRSSSRRR